MRHTHEVTNNKRLTLPNAVAALKKTTTQFVRHTNATATRVEQPWMVCIIANRFDVSQAAVAGFLNRATHVAR